LARISKTTKPTSFFVNLGSTDVQAKKERKSDPDYRKLRRALCVGYGNQLAERMLHHNGYHTVGYRAQLVQVLTSAIYQISFAIVSSINGKGKLR
jgi:hypothetical protein